MENLHYDITESDLEVCIPKDHIEPLAIVLTSIPHQDLFGRIGPVSDLSLVYDRAGRSEGVAFVTYTYLKDAHESLREFDGANAKGQPIRLTLVPGRRGERATGGTLFDRVERPKSPGSDTEDGPRRRRGGGRAQRSDVTKPAPDHIDRYIPGQRSPARRNGGGGGSRRAGGRDSRPRNAEGGGRRAANGRPRKTQEELDQEMEDYWGGNNADTETTEKQPVQDAAQPAAPAAPAPVAADDDIDMIE